jgi:hypothetical protein
MTSIKSYCFTVVFMLLFSNYIKAQTDVDAIMIPHNNFCVGAMYSNSSWKEYWEGSFKRDNLNLGRVTTQMYSVMGNYGISNKLNVLFNVPYVTTHASGGTLKGMKSLQDLSLSIKWKAFQNELGKGNISLFAIGGLALPLTDYVADFLPMSVGMHSKNLSLRGMADYQINSFFVTASAIYIRRSNITIDRTAYYTNEMHYTNEVKMPDMAGFNVRAGLRSRQWIAEVVIDKSKTLGGFDIRKNDMPFPSNEMNSTRAGINFKYTSHYLRGLELTGGSNYVISGRNVGQSFMLNGGAFYIMDFSKKKK